MIRILIVDDEQIERDALQKVMEKGIAGIQVVGQAENGSQAIKLASELEPDLILMDIQMPGINGMEAIKQIKDQQPIIKYIMVTAFDTFEFARQALRYEVKDYLLKPSKTQIIVDTVRRVVTEIIKEKQQFAHHEEEQLKLQKLMPIVEADLVTQLLFDHVHEIHLDEMLKLFSVAESSPFFVAVVSILPAIEDTDVTDASSEQSGIKAKVLYSAIKKQFHKTENGWIGPMSGRQIPIIIFSDLQRSYRSQAASIVRKLDQLSFALNSTRLFIGIGGLYKSLADVRSSYHEALLASIHLELPSKHQFYEANTNQREEYIISADVEKRIVEEARRGNWIYIQHEILQMVNRYETAKKPVVEVQQKVFELIFVVSRLLLEMGVQADQSVIFPQIATYQQLKTQASVCLDDMEKAYFLVKNQLEPDVMIQIKQYIRDHAHEDISLEIISERVRLSPFYVSKMFKEQFSTNYIDFLTECRIEKAKQLLGDPDKSLKEITYEIGYKDPNYFSRVFKKMTNLSPSDYRKELIARKR
ncbi:MAG: response regulator [Paenibacillaceae bacterium]